MDAAQLKQAGFSDQDVSQYTELQKAGFSDPEITDYLSKGIPSNVPKPESVPSSLPWSQRAQRVFEWPGAKEAGKQFIKGVTPALGITGGVLGTPLGPWGTALGYAGGERVGRAIETLTGVSKPETPTEAATKTALDVGVGMIPFAAGKVPEVAKGIKEIITKPLTRRGKVGEVFKTIGGKLEPSLAGESATVGAKSQYSALSQQGNKLYEDWKALFPKETKTKL